MCGLALSLADEAVGEERLEGGRERGHRAASSWNALEPLGGQGEQLRRGGQVPVGVAGVGVPEVGRQPRQLRLDVGPGAVASRAAWRPRRSGAGHGAWAAGGDRGSSPALAGRSRNVSQVRS